MIGIGGMAAGIEGGWRDDERAEAMGAGKSALVGYITCGSLPPKL